jgi:acetylornithine deacetylase
MPASSSFKGMNVQDILSNLVAFDTTSAKTNIPCAEWVRDYLLAHGIETHYIPAADGIHASVFATVSGSGGARGAGIALSGHMDVVPVTGQPWDTNPFEMVRKGDRLYGRGTTDMKGYLACMLAMVPEMTATRLSRPVHLVFSYDEEVGCTGVLEMIAEFGKSLPKPEIVFVGEPSMMSVVDSHKGGYRFETTVYGKDAHSSRPNIGVGAIFAAADLIAELKHMEERLKPSTTNPRFDPDHLTITVSSIEGGVAHNIIPPKCTFSWGVRAMPGHDARALAGDLQAYAEANLLPAMRAVHPDCRVETQIMGGIPPFWSGEDSPSRSMAMKLAGQNATFAVPYGTEASHFQAAGCSTVVCGPGHIDQAHQPNEFIDISELDNCIGFLRRMTAQLSS